MPFPFWLFIWLFQCKCENLCSVDYSDKLQVERDADLELKTEKGKGLFQWTNPLN